MLINTFYIIIIINTINCLDWNKRKLTCSLTRDAAIPTLSPASKAKVKFLFWNKIKIKIIK